MINKKLFAWDFHGTLEQGTEIGFTEILKMLSKKFNIPAKIDLEEVRRLFGTSITDYLKHFFPRAEDKVIEKMRAQISKNQNQEHLAQFVMATPYAVEVLQKIKKAGHKNIIVSNSHPDHIKKFVKTVGMDNLFDEIFAIDIHYTFLAADPIKEKAKSIKSFAKKHNFGKSQIVLIGDRITDVNAGLSVGATVYQYTRKGFPYDETNAHFKITDLRQVLKEIE